MRYIENETRSDAIDRNHPLWIDFHTKPYRGSARLSIFVAKEAPVALVIRRQPSKLWTFFRWDLITNELTEGGSYKDIFWAAGCDISWDGRYWAFYGFSTSGICHVPEMKPVVEWENSYGWGGSCFFDRPDRVRTDSGTRLPKITEPFRVENCHRGPNIEQARLKRDGWKFEGNVARQRPSIEHPALLLERGSQDRRWQFSMPEVEGLIDHTVFSATYTSSRDLLVAQRGYLVRYDLPGIRRREPTFWLDLNLVRKSSRA